MDQFEYLTPVWHGGTVIGRISQCATEDGDTYGEPKLYDAWLGVIGYHNLAHGVTRSDAIAAIVKFEMR